MKTDTTTPPPEAATAPDSERLGVVLPRLVRQVSRALKKTKRLMFWDIEPDENDILDRLGRYLKNSYTEREAVENVIEGMLHSHQETLCDAARDQCRCATKAPLASLPNAKSAGTDASEKTL